MCAPLSGSCRSGGLRGPTGATVPFRRGGDSYDNALAETVNGLYKAEVTRHEGPWRGKKDVEMATLDWVHWYNDKRLYGPLGYTSPATAERNFYNAELAAKIAAE